MLLFILQKRYSVFFVFVCFFQIIQAQYFSLNKNYQTKNLYNLNPAAAGFDGAFITQLEVSKSWLGIDGSPTYELLSNSIRLGEEEFYDPNMFINQPIINLAPRVGLGITIFNESTGPLRHTGLLFAYAYHISLHDKRLSFGLSGSVSQYHLNTQEFKPIVEEDPELYTDNESAVVPDINFGILYYSRKYFLGFTANRLVNLNETMDHSETQPDLVIMGGYRYNINPAFKFEPSVFIWRHGNGLFATDLNTKLYYKDRNYLLLSYKSSREILAGFCVSLNRSLRISYTFSSGTSGLNSYSAGSHSIIFEADIASLIQNIK